MPRPAPAVQAYAPVRVAWRVGATAGVACVMLLTLYASTVEAIAARWWITGYYNYGSLVLPICGYLMWRARNALARLTPRSSTAGVVTILGLSVLWFATYTLRLQAAAYFCVVLLVPATVWALYGRAVLRALAGPLVLLFLATPGWDLLAIPLQNLTTAVVYRMLHLLGVPVFVEGHYIAIPAGRFLIEDVCSGLRYLLTALLFGALFSILYLHRNAARLLFVMAALLMALAANWVRVTLVILAGHLRGMDHPWVSDHITLGWVLFAIAMVPLLWLGVAIGRREPMPVSEVADVSTASRSAHWLPAAALAALGVGPLAAYALEAIPAAAVVGVPPPKLHTWTGPYPVEHDWRPQFQGAVTEYLVQYHGRRRVDFYTAGYGRSRTDAELISGGNRISGVAWQPIKENSRELTLAARNAWAVREVELRAADGRRRLVWYWYHVDGRNTTSAVVAKLRELIALTHASTGSYVIAVATEYVESPHEARRALTDFLIAAAPIAATIEAGG